MKPFNIHVTYIILLAMQDGALMHANDSSDSSAVFNQVKFQENSAGDTYLVDTQKGDLSTNLSRG
jgi:hypothetical protein